MKNIENRGKIAIKINSKIINTDDITLSAEEIELLKKVLFSNKVSLCPSCKAKVCLANKENLTGAIFEGISSSNDALITDCANYRKSL